jgi:maltodextrin utilization protein YvdJ
MLKKIFIPLALIGVPIMFFVMMKYAEIHPIPIQQAISQADAQSESEQNKKCSIEGVVDESPSQPISIQPGTSEFYIKDASGKVLRISYDGKEKIESLTNGEKVTVFGHIHLGEPPYLHCSQIIK